MMSAPLPPVSSTPYRASSPWRSSTNIVRVLAALHLLVGPDGCDPARTHQRAELDRGQSDAARRARHQQGFAGLVAAALLQGVVRGAVGHGEGRAVLVAHIVRHRQELAGIDHGFGGIAAMADHADHTIALLVAGDTLTQLDDVAGDPRPGAKDAGGELVLIGDDQRVGEIDTRRRPRRGPAPAQRLGRQLDQLQAFRARPAFRSASRACRTLPSRCFVLWRH